MYKYPTNDMASVYTHYDEKSKKNIQTPNIISTPKEEESNDKDKDKL